MSAQAREAVRRHFQKAHWVKHFRSTADYNLMARRRAVFELAAQEPAPRLLDLGCGAGAYLELAPALGARYVGVDFAPNMIAAARERARELRLEHATCLLVGDATQTAFADGSFDLAIGVGLIEYFAEPAPLLAELRRVLRPGGRLILQAYLPSRYPEGLWELMKRGRNRLLRRDVGFRHRRYGARALDRLLAGVGFALVDWRFANFHLLPRTQLQALLPALHVVPAEWLARHHGRGLETLAVNYVGCYRRG